MKKFDPVQVIGLAVCVVILLVGMRHSASVRKEEQAQAAARQQQQLLARQQADAAQKGISAMQASEKPSTQEKTASSSVPSVRRGEHLLSVPGIFQISVDGNGEGVKSATLDKYMVQSREAGRKNAHQVLTSLDLPFLGMYSGTAELTEASAPEYADGRVRIHRRDAATGLAFDESWEVSAQSENAYDITYRLVLTNRGTAPVAVNALRLECGALPDFLSEESNTSFSSGISGGVAYGIPLKEKAELLNQKSVTKKMNEKRAMQYRMTPVSWLCVHSKYFMFALRHLQIGDVPSNFAGFLAGGVAGGARTGCHAAAYLPDFNLQPGETRCVTVSGYAGPKDYRTLQRMGQGIDSIMGMDYFFFWHFKWMGWICRVLLECMTFFAGWFPSCIAYGMGIILVTLLVKLIFLPLSWKSTRDMRKMSAVQPELKALREKYGKDPQRMYYEQQKLFRERGVSQLGGCLPMLVQIPVFFAMFNTFRAAVEIRNAQFLWALDLSMPDAVFGLPIHPLALMTGITMFIQQKLTPMPDPNQGKMMNIMSLVFIVFFYNMPAGLTLYMTVNQLFSVIQMLLFRRWDKQQGKAVAPATGR